MTGRRWPGELLPARNPAGAEKYPGEQFGLPERGPRSVASMGRRLLALLIDWLATARARSCQLRYAKPAETLLSLARLSEVERLLSG